MRQIEDTEISNIEGLKMRVPIRDDDGDIVWKDKCALCGFPEDGSLPTTEPLTIAKAIRLMIFSIPAEIRKPADSENAYRVMQSIRQSDNGLLTLEDSDFEFLQRLISRPLPKIENQETQTLGSALWGINCYAVEDQIFTSEVEYMAIHDPNKKAKV